MRFFSSFCAVAAVVVLLTLGSVARADDMPKFSSPEVTTFVKAYSDFTDQYVAAIKASKSGDSSKLTEVNAKAGDLQSKAAAMGGKLKPDEAKPYSDFMTKCAQRMSNAASDL